ncbi:hypothetical protein [Nonomuraea jabiensis]|uniref:Uncharacterized protein n=1 Tax=Nonomuraea jabiensis TaxID=882448 RepID=A0A7W9G1I2_9ACTN|nr:hypothetical protein [Nonomuraea jabiensis]MBB5775426.1 hypothetical protein [Nonomuraea jabiensis]
MGEVHVLQPRAEHALRTMGNDELARAVVAALRTAQLSGRGQLEEHLASAPVGQHLALDRT